MITSGLDYWTDDKVGYESLFADMLVTKSLLFSVIGLNETGRSWVDRLTAYGFATLAIADTGADDAAFHDALGDRGMVRISGDLDEIRSSDVVLHAGEFPGPREIRSLVSHLKRGQVMVSLVENRPLQAAETIVLEELGCEGFRIGEDLFWTFLPRDVIRKGAVPASVMGLTEACSRIGTSLCREVLAELIADSA